MITNATPTTAPPFTPARSAAAALPLDLAVRLRLLVTRTARRLRQEADPGISPSAISALSSVERRGPLRPSELAATERIQRPTATRILGRLEDDGLIARTTDPADGRVCLVAVTPAGRALLRQLRSRKNAYLAKRLRGLGPDELATLQRASEILERALGDGA